MQFVAILGLKYKSIHRVLMGLHDDPLPENKTRVMTDGRTDGRTGKVFMVTLRLRFAARVIYEQMMRDITSSVAIYFSAVIR